MYEVTLKYKRDAVTVWNHNFHEARLEAWLQMSIIALVYYNPDRDAQLAMDECREGTRMFCKYIAG